MSEQLEQKQKYLRDKILNVGYDAEAFMSYCQEKYGQINLEAWTFPKLKQIVKGFLGDKAEETFTQQQLDDEEFCDYQEEQEVEENKQIPIVQSIQKKTQMVFSEADWGIFGIAPPHKNEEPVTQKNDFEKMNSTSMSPATQCQLKHQPTIPSKQEIEKKSSVEMKSPTNPNVEPQKKSQEFQVLKIEQTSWPSDKISQKGQIQISVIKSKGLKEMHTINDIKIIKTEQKTRNFLQGDYTVYHIQFNPGNHVIQRKFNDFRKLRTIIQKIYPHIRLPYLEPEGWLVNSSEGKDIQTLNKYKYMIVEFLKYIAIRNDLLKNSKIVRIFTGLIESTPTDFKKYENIAKPKIFSQLCLPNGVIAFGKYDSMSVIDKYMTNTQILSGNIDIQYQKLRKALDTLFYNYDNVSKSLIEVANIFETLQGTIQKFNFDNNDKKDLRVFEGIKQVCIKMKQTVDGHNTLFKNQIQALFKYERDNMTTLKETNELRSKMFSEYARQGLLSKGVTAYVPKDETMVDGNFSIEEPCKNNKHILTVQNLFWSHFTVKNADDYWKELRQKINEKLSLIAYDELDAENRNLNFWNNVIKKCVI